jgi:hypothetical protein
VNKATKIVSASKYPVLCDRSSIKMIHSTIEGHAKQRWNHHNFDVHLRGPEDCRLSLDRDFLSNYPVLKTPSKAEVSQLQYDELSLMTNKIWQCVLGRSWTASSRPQPCRRIICVQHKRHLLSKFIITGGQTSYNFQGKEDSRRVKARSQGCAPRRRSGNHSCRRGTG